MDQSHGDRGASSRDLRALISHGAPSQRIGTRASAAISAGQFVADVAALARELPPRPYVMNLCADRYLFAVTFAAAVSSGRTNLLPPARTPEAFARVAAGHPDSVAVFDGDDAPPIENALRVRAHAGSATESSWPPPSIAGAHIAAITFTSGSTGEPLPQSKRWGSLVDGAAAEIIALGLDQESLADVVLIGTVSPQHMYGLESTVLLALHGPCALAAEHPLHAEQIAAVLRRQSGRRVLVTTPVHLRALSELQVPLGAIDRIVSATAPLAAELAARCEALWDTRVLEVYGCTETGQVATRRTVEGPRWTTMRDVRVELREDGFWALGGHIASAGPLADRLRLHDASSFELEGRLSDLVNVGGKRASLAGLTHVLLGVDGVRDGIFAVNERDADGREPRLLALVVAPGRSKHEILAALRARIDPVFLPRPLVLVDRLPRNAQGKLPRAEVVALVSRAAR